MRIWLAVGGLFVVIVVGIILFLSRPQYVALQTGLEYDEMSAITTALTAQGITYKEEPEVIYVDMDDLVKAKMVMATDTTISIPDYGWANVFADTSLTMTTEVREAQFNLATANTLAQGLESLQGVNKAQVILQILPESNFALSKPTESRASVILELASGFSFSQQQVTGIENLILTSVENLKKENITITDQTGLPLNGLSVETEAFLASTNYDQKLKVEATLDSKMTELLGVAFGMNNVKVISNATLNFDDNTTESTTYAPPVEGEVTGMIRSIQEIQETVNSGDTAEGVPGTDTNGETTDYPTGTNSSSSASNTSKLVNYEMNTIHNVVTAAKGTITDMSFAVMLNTTALPDETLSDELRQEIVNLITNAAGVETRSVQVTTLPFTDNLYGGELYTSDEELISPGIPLWLVGLIVGVIALVVVVIFVLNRRRTTKDQEAEIARIQAEEEAKRQEELEEIRTDVEDKSSPKYQIEKFIDAKPESVAALLRSWMSEM